MRPVTAEIRGFICIAKELKFREKDPTAIYYDGKIADWDTIVSALSFRQVSTWFR